MDLDGCILQVQKYLEDVPLVVLGSGSSAAYGLPTMSALSEELIRNSDKFSHDDQAIDDFLLSLKSGEDIESAIGHAHQLKDSDNKLIRKIIWEHVNIKDKAYFDQGLKNSFAGFSLVDLINKIITPTPYTADIITTNYDRLAEYAVDIAGANVITGFEGSYLKKMELPSPSTVSRRIHARERDVSIWKVHGSLDWFLSKSGEHCSLLGYSNVPDGYYPCIVPPGKNKYHDTHQDPYRTIIAQADKAITAAKCFLIIGYGFNDDHIQPKIIEEIKKGKPIVVIAKKATESCKKEVAASGVQKYLIIEEEDEKTHVISNDWEEYYDEDFWSLSGFMKIW